AMGRPDDGLRAEVKDRGRFMPADRPLQGGEVLHGAVDDGDMADVPTAVQLRARVHVLDEGHHGGPASKKFLDQPGTDHAGRPSDQYALPYPESSRWRHVRTVMGWLWIQGHLPLSTRLFSRRTSRSVSMHCQNPSWRNAAS